MDDNVFILFHFPDYQPFMEIEGYRENAVTPMPLDADTDEFNSALMIRKSWLDKLNKE